jgi:hypothetical protein
MSSKWSKRYREFLKTTYILYEFDITDSYEEWGFLGTMQTFLDTVGECEEIGIFYSMYHYGIHSLEIYNGMANNGRITRLTQKEYENMDGKWDISNFEI